MVLREEKLPRPKKLFQRGHLLKWATIYNDYCCLQESEIIYDKDMKKKTGCFTPNQKKELACNTESVLKDSDDLNIAGVELIYHRLFPACWNHKRFLWVLITAISATIAAVTLLSRVSF